MTADIIEASDREAGEDVDALHAKLRDALASGEKWYLERDEARAEIGRLKRESDPDVPTIAYLAGAHDWKKRADNAEAEIERLKAEVIEKDAAIERWAAMSHDQSKQTDALAAQVAVVTEALQALLNATSGGFGYQKNRIDAAASKSRSALTDLPARAEAMLRVVEAARIYCTTGQYLDGKKLIHALRALDGDAS